MEIEMYRVLKNHMVTSCSDLEHQIRRLQTEISEIEQVISALNSLKGLDGCARELRRQKSILLEELRDYKQLLSTLDISLVVYNKCENNVMNECLNSHGYYTTDPDTMI